MLHFLFLLSSLIWRTYFQSLISHISLLRIFSLKLLHAMHAVHFGGLTVHCCRQKEAASRPCMVPGLLLDALTAQHDRISLGKRIKFSIRFNHVFHTCVLCWGSLIMFILVYTIGCHYKHSRGIFLGMHLMIIIILVLPVPSHVTKLLLAYWR